MGTSRVVVTGAGGFIGSHLVERLSEDQAEVVALCHYNSRGSFGWLDSSDVAEKGVSLVLGDVRDPGFINDFIQDGDVVFHLAALIGIPYSYAAPRSYVDTNVIGTLNILEAATHKANVKMIHTSTSEVYGTPDHVPIRESHAIRPQSPYAASKVSADALCRSFASSFGTDVSIIRPFNTFGPRQSMRAVIPTVLNQLMFGDGTVRLGSLTPKRDFTFVTDTVEAMVRMAEADVEKGSVIHLGTGISYSIQEVVEICELEVGRQGLLVPEEERRRPAESEVQVLQSDPSLAHDVLNWRPRIDLAKGIGFVHKWLKECPDLQQVSRYFT